jgi:hypothetical protein
VDVGGTVTQIVAGEDHTCALLDTGSQTCALLDTGTVRCWGFSLEDRLGYGNSTDIGDDETPASAGDVDVVDPGNLVTLGVTGLPALATFPLPSTANPVASTFTWTPILSDVGSHAITFTAQDSSSLFATPHAVTVEVQQAPVVPRVAPWWLAALAGAFVLLIGWGLRRRATAFLR